MTVLWFSLSPGGSVRRYSEENYAQGWMASFEDVVKQVPEIDLHVAFVSKTEKASFLYDNVTYHPVFRSKKALLEDRLTSGRKGYQGYLDRFLQIIDECNPDIIHIHGTEECFGMIARYVENIPIVYSLQGLINPYIEKFFSGLSFGQIWRYEDIFKKITLQGVFNQFRKFCHVGQREAIYLAEASNVLGRTAWDCNIAHLYNPNINYQVVNEPLRRPFYNVVWHKTTFGDDLQIVSTISGGYYKGFETLLKTASLLKCHGLKFSWSVIGLNTGDEIVNISEKVTRINSLNVNVNLLGKKNAEQMADILSCSDIFCLVSHIENSPNSLCEAMLVGLPCISTDVGGVSSILTSGKEGVLVQDGDPYALAGEIIHLQNNFDQAVELAENARARAMSRHNYGNIRDELLSAYHSILSDN